MYSIWLAAFQCNHNNFGKLPLTLPLCDNRGDIYIYIYSSVVNLVILDLVRVARLSRKECRPTHFGRSEILKVVGSNPDLAFFNAG